MILTNHLLHFNRKKHMNVLEQFFYAIKDEKMNEVLNEFFHNLFMIYKIQIFNNLYIFLTNIKTFINFFSLKNFSSYIQISSSMVEMMRTTQ